MGLLSKDSNSCLYYLITESSIKSESEMLPFFLLFWQSSRTFPPAFNSVSQCLLRRKDGLQSLSHVFGERGFKCQLHTHDWMDSVNYRTVEGLAVSIVEKKQNHWKEIGNFLCVKEWSTLMYRLHTESSHPSSTWTLKAFSKCLKQGIVGKFVNTVNSIYAALTLTHIYGI